MANKLFMLLLAFSLASYVNIDQESLVKIQSSSSLTLQLTSNPSTGYWWTARNPNSDKISIENLSGSYIAPPDNSPPGTPGLQLFKVVCNEKCKIGDTFSLYFDLQRSWEPEPIETRSITLQVIN